MRTPVVLIGIALTGCVGKGKFDALQAELDATKAEMSTRFDAHAAESLSLKDALAREQQRSADLERKLAQLLSDKSALDDSVAQMEAAMRDLEDRKKQADARIAEYRDLLSKFQAMIDSGKLKVKIVGGRMVVELASDILFASGSASLAPDGRQSLLDVATVLASISGRHFQVEGHTDDDPIKTERFPSNWELGAGRAITVVETLKEGGVPIEFLSAASYGLYRPVQPNQSAEGKAANRRIEIVVVPDLSELPGYDELEAFAKP